MGNIAFLWDNLGPSHVDEADAVADAMRGEREVITIELFSTSDTYGWGRWQGRSFKQVTLYDATSDRTRAGVLRTAFKIVRTCRKNSVQHAFLCHYERPCIWLAAMALRLSGCRTFVLSDSKFDDFPRKLWREVLKRVMLLPYKGTITASPRSADFIRLLGINRTNIETGYDTISFDRVRAAAGIAPAPGGTPYGERYFLCVARLVPKKNHAMLLDAYALYKASATAPRKLVLCGSGPLEDEIRARIAELRLEDDIVVRGNVSPDEVAVDLGRTLALLLVSTEEQYGIVVLEAQAMGLPVILSTNPGARDLQLRSGINGFLVEPGNAAGMAYFMQSLAEDEALWMRMAKETNASASKTGDVARFVEAVRTLIARHS